MSTAGLQVLIADDDRDAANLLAVLERLWGHAARVAYGGDAALAMTQSDPPDVALVDLSMPGMDGAELALRMRAALRGGSPTLVAFSGRGDAETCGRAYKAGFAYYLCKPVAPEFLKAFLDSLSRQG
jgi:DNA-binding response OmpR family regulator